MPIGHATTDLFQTLTVIKAAGPPSGLAAKIALQRANLEIALKVGLDPLRRGDGPRKSGVVGDFMQEGSPTQRLAVGQGRHPIRGVEDELNPPVLDGINDV